MHLTYHLRVQRQIEWNEKKNIGNDSKIKFQKYQQYTNILRVCQRIEKGQIIVNKLINLRARISLTVYGSIKNREREAKIMKNDGCSTRNDRYEANVPLTHCGL